MSAALPERQAAGRYRLADLVVLRNAALAERLAAGRYRLADLVVPRNAASDRCRAVPS